MNERADVLHRESFIHKLNLLVEMLSKKKQGCCFGVDGAWGSGKSFVLEKFEEQLKAIQLEETADNKYYVFHYDCWKYDYYDEPTIAIIAAMLDATDKELSLLPGEIRKLGLETVKSTLLKIASELCKNKIGIDLVEIVSDVSEKLEKSSNGFDSLFSFKQALEETRNGIQSIAESKTVVIVVDELDRCLPTYSIKVLERLHHIFGEIDNVIVIVSMDKKQLSHSIKEIYGDIEVDTYLRKFILFKVELDNGNTSSYATKFHSYFSMFDVSEPGLERIEKFFSDILVGLDMRTQERIFNKAEIIHGIIKDDQIRDCSIMTFEILYLTVSLRTNSKDLKWLSQIHSVIHTQNMKILGEPYYNMLKGYEEKARCRELVYFKNDYNYQINDTTIGKTFFWLANLYGSYEHGVCKPYVYANADKSVALVHRFGELVDFVDCN